MSAECKRKKSLPHVAVVSLFPTVVAEAGAMRRAMIRVRFLPWRQEQDSAARIVTQPLLYYHSLSKDPLPFYYLHRKDRRKSSLTV